MNADRPVNAISGFVFDACALIAYLRDEQGAAEAVELLADASGPRSVHSLNLCEVFYDSVRRVGEVAALAEIDDLLDLGPVECPYMTHEAWKTAGRVKAFHMRLSLVNCFAIALATSRGAALVTTDRVELEPIGEAGISRIHFLR